MSEVTEVAVLATPKECEDDVAPVLWRGRDHGVDDGVVDRSLQVLK